MSFYGFNSAAINGGVSSAIAGEAQMKAVSTFYAEGTRIQNGEAVFAGQSNGTAEGVRIVMAGVNLAGGSDLYAQWSIISDAHITMAGKSAFRATPVGVYLPATSNFSAEPTLIQPGAADMTGVSSLQAAPQLTAYGAVAMAGSGGFIADAGVKLSGQSTTQREGSVALKGSSSFSAAATRIALCTLDMTARSALDLTYTYIQGGAATFSGVSDFRAVGSTEFVNFIGDSDFLANGQVTRFGAMVAEATSSFTAERNVLTQGPALAYEASSRFSAAGRLALRASAQFTTTSSGSAAGRLALQGAATFVAAGSLDLDPTVIVTPDPIEFASTSELTANWVVLRQGGADFTATSSFAAIGKTNQEADDPPERTMRRPTTERAMRRPGINREMRRTP